MRVSEAKHKTILLLIITSIFVFADMAYTQEIGLFRLRRWNGSMLLRMQREKKISPDLSKKFGYSGRLFIRNSGFVINPDLLSIEWRGEVGLFLQHYITEDLQRNTRGRLIGNNLTASFFQSSKNSLIFLWNQNKNVITLEDNGRTSYDINTVQALFNSQGSWLQSRLKVEWNDLLEVWERLDFKTTRNQLRRAIDYSGKREKENSTIKIEYNLSDIQNRIQTKSSYIRHRGNILNRYKFGKDNSNQWDSGLLLYFRKGLGNHKNAKLNQSLVLQHYPYLSSRYSHSLSISHSKGIGTSLLNSAYATILHSLYASLNSNFGVGGSYIKMREGNAHNYSISGGISYSKRIPLSGRLQAGYTQGYSINNNQIKSTENAVVAERHVFIGGLPVMLNERNIILSTIVIFDNNSDLIFEEGEDKDYTLRVIGDRVEIQRNVFGRIQEDVVILVDYNFQTIPEMRYSTITKIFNAGLNFGWLAFNYTINRHAQQLLAGDPIYDANLQDLFTKSFQMKISLRGEHAGLSLTAENRFFKSKTLDFNSVNARYAIFVKPWSSLTLSNNFTLSLINHHREKAVIKVYALRSELNWRPSGAFLFQVYGRYRTRKESLRIEESSFEYGGLLQRFWRIFRILVRYENRKWEIIPKQIKERRFTIEIERIFY